MHKNTFSTKEDKYVLEEIRQREKREAKSQNLESVILNRPSECLEISPKKSF
jgi:hypothetical protein